MKFSFGIVQHRTDIGESKTPVAVVVLDERRILVRYIPKHRLFIHAR